MRLRINKEYHCKSLQGSAAVGVGGQNEPLDKKEVTIHSHSIHIYSYSHSLPLSLSPFPPSFFLFLYTHVVESMPPT